MCAKLFPDDFEERAWMPGSGWPITQDDLNPFYRMAHRTCEVGAADYDVAAFSEQRGHPLLPVDSDRIETVIYHQSGPTRFGTRYRADFEGNTDADVYLNANLVNIELNEMGDGAGLPLYDSLRNALLRGSTSVLPGARWRRKSPITLSHR